MRGLRSTLALLVVLSASAPTSTSSPGSSRPTAATESNRKRCSPRSKPTRSKRSRSSRETGDVTTLKKDDGAWQIVAPMAAKAAESEVSGITSALGQLEIVRVIDENPTDLERIRPGDAAHRDRVQGGRAARTTGQLLIGDKTPTGGRSVREAQRREAGVPDPGVPGIVAQPSTFDLRDKTLLKFERDKVDGVEVTAGGKTLAARQGRHRLEDHEADRRPRRLRLGRGPRRPARDGADEVDRRRERRRRPT